MLFKNPVHISTEYFFKFFFRNKKKRIILMFLFLNLFTKMEIVRILEQRLMQVKKQKLPRMECQVIKTIVRD